MSLRHLLSIIILSSLLTSCIIPEKKRDSVKSKYAEMHKARSFYLYQSVLRVANINQDRDINRLIKDLDRVDVHLLNGPNAQSDLKKIAKQLRTDGFEDLISTRIKDQGLINLKSLNKGGKERFVLVGNMEGRNVFVEFQGKLNLEYLNALGNADWSKLTDQLGGNNFGIIDEEDHNSNRETPDEIEPIEDEEEKPAL